MMLIDSFLINLVSKLKYVDNLGNKYYNSIFDNKRFIVYNGIADAAKIPPKYYLWLHKIVDEVSELDSQIDLMKDRSKFIDGVNKKVYYSSWSPKT